jgi:hypothetical protein
VHELDGVLFRGPILPMSLVTISRTVGRLMGSLGYNPVAAAGRAKMKGKKA